MINKILVVDFGSQFNQVIVKTLRQLKVYAELVPFSKINAQYLKQRPEVKGLILSGGPQSVYDSKAYHLSNDIFDLNIPILGICYGMQYLAKHFGSKVEPSDFKEYGDHQIEIIKDDHLLANTPIKQQVWMSHGDVVTKLGPELVLLAKSQNHLAIFKHQSKAIYGTQFHLELSHTTHGKTILSNFLKICQIEKNFSMAKYLTDLKANIKKQVGKEKVICALSGGVDSTIVGALLNTILPNQVYFFFVDTGLLRLNEAKEVKKTLEKQLGLNLYLINGQKQMLKNLKNVSDPEIKRKIIGQTFIQLFTKKIKEVTKKEKIKFLAQGTLYSDVIESGTNVAAKIKSHHNVGGLPKKLNFELVEPLNRLFKDEVRELGLMLNLPQSLVNRQPFPGPGLGIRIIGKITEEKIAIVQKADAILRTYIEKNNVHKNLWQYFCVLTNTKSVGVKGDQRAYEYVLALRIVESQDGMSANFAHLDYKLLNQISTAITNQVANITRVVYDISSKPPATIEWE